MSRYRAKPVEVLAFRWDGPETQLPDWAGETELIVMKYADGELDYMLKVPNSPAVWPGEWVVRDMRTDVLAVWDDDTFHTYYEPVEEPAP